MPLNQTALNHIHSALDRVQNAVRELQQVADGLQPQPAPVSLKQTTKAKVKWLFEKEKVVGYRDRVRREREHLADAFRILQQSQK